MSFKNYKNTTGYGIDISETSAKDVLNLLEHFIEDDRFCFSKESEYPIEKIRTALKNTQPDENYYFLLDYVSSVISPNTGLMMLEGLSGIINDILHSLEGYKMFSVYVDKTDETYEYVYILYQPPFFKPEKIYSRKAIIDKLNKLAKLLNIKCKPNYYDVYWDI